jgi:small subunit ribosomal protein S3
MGQKVNPIGFRTGVVIGWKSRWYASKQEFAELLVEDQKIRGFIKNHPDNRFKAQYRNAGIDRIEIERTRDEVRVMLFVARPGADYRQEGSGRREAAGRAPVVDWPPSEFEDRRGGSA